MKSFSILTSPIAEALAAVALVSMAIPAFAKPLDVDMSPGLWESKMRYTGDGAEQMQQMQSGQMEAAMEEMKKQFAAMPPEQRKQMEALMAQSGMEITDEGMNFKNDQVSMTKEGITTKQCVTQAQIDSGEMGFEEGDECTHSLTQVSKNRFKSLQECGGENPSRSEAEITFSSPKRYSGTGVMTQTINGQTHNISVAVEGSWLGSDCGSIQPDEQP